MDIQELVRTVTLEDVRCVLSVAELGAGPSVASWVPPDDEVEVEPAVGARSVSWDRTIEVWFRLEYTSGEVRVVVAFAILYRRDSDVIVPRSVRDEFVNRVAFMATFPYLREAVQRLLADLRFGTVVLPILRPGDVNFALDYDDLAQDAGEDGN